jgi:uncharacterized delta-60 repeat protein
MKNLLLVLLLCSIICFDYAAAQVDTMWVKRFNGSSNQDDEAKIIKMDNNGFIYVAGTVYTDPGLKNYGVIKYTPDGDTLWVKYFNSVNGLESELNDMTIDNDNNVIVTGTNFITGNSDYATVKWDSDGNLLWAKTYDGGDIDFAYAIAVDQSGNVCVTGTSWKPVQSYNYMTIKYDPDGDTLWTHTFIGNDDAGDIARAIAVDNTGSIIISGTTDWRWGTNDIVTIKLNTAGDTVWVSQYDSPQNGQDGFSAMAVDASNNIYIAGLTYTNNNDIVLIKYNPSGDTVWTQKYIGPGNGNDQISDMVVDNSGNIYATGKTYTADTGIDFLTIKYNSAGVLQWVKTYAGLGSYGDYAGSIALDDLGNVYVTGTTEKSSINSDYLTIKYDTDGNEQWSITYKGPDDRNDYGNSICLDDSGYIYVTGMSGSLSTGFDFATIKYTQTPNNLQESWQKVPEEFILFQNYPNPFNSSTNIEFRIPKKEFVTLRIFNILGEEVAILVSGQLVAGSHQFEWDATGMTSGVYIYKLDAGSYSAVKKLVLLK